MDSDNGGVRGGDHVSARTVCPAAEASSNAPESAAADALSHLDALSTVAALTQPAAAEDDAYHCPYEGCGRKFKTPGALHTHTGWHKRHDNMDKGIYERQGHDQKETHHVTDGHGTLRCVNLYRCQMEGCGKLFQTRGALFTHLGWHKRKPQAKRSLSDTNTAAAVITSMHAIASPLPGTGTQKVEVPRKRIRKDNISSQPPGSSSATKAKSEGSLAEQLSLQQAALTAQMQEMTSASGLSRGAYSSHSMYGVGSSSAPQIHEANILSSSRSFPSDAASSIEHAISTATGTQSHFTQDQQMSARPGAQVPGQSQTDLGLRSEQFQLSAAAQQQWRQAAQNLQTKEHGAHTQSVSISPLQLQLQQQQLQIQAQLQQLQAQPQPQLAQQVQLQQYSVSPIDELSEV